MAFEGLQCSLQEALVAPTYEHEKWSTPRRVRVAEQVAKGMQYLHTMPLRARMAITPFDLTAASVLLSHAGVAKLAWFSRAGLDDNRPPGYGSVAWAVTMADAARVVAATASRQRVDGASCTPCPMVVFFASYRYTRWAN